MIKDNRKWAILMPDEREDGSRFILDYPDAELVIGMVCAVGADYSKVSDYLQKTLPSFGYKANVLKVSNFIPETAQAMKLQCPLSQTNEAERLKDYMNAGNLIRRESEHCDFFALVAASRLASSRRGFNSEKPEPFRRAAHIILTLKRPEEVETLRRIYGDGFFLVGVFSTEQERLDFLMDEKDISKEKAIQLIRKDLEDEDKDFGQRTRDTFHRADVFVELQGDRYKQELRRFLKLVFGYPYTAPTPDEFGMYHAYAASLRSAQLGRQVGASILNEACDLIAVGCNEVPAAGGGLYWEGRKPDQRDHVLKEDSNDRRKSQIVKDIYVRLGEGKLLAQSSSLYGAEAVLRRSLLWDITEFGRAVHAEMEALLSCGRSAVSPRGGTLYATTFPCHNCTRHVIAAGLKRVVYIEPYAKSLAARLHEDAIRVEDAVQKGKGKNSRDHRVPFEPFIGVGPRRFLDLFSIMLSAGYPIERKDKSGAIFNWNSRRDSKPRIPMAPSSYLQREVLASKAVYSIFKLR